MVSDTRKKKKTKNKQKGYITQSSQYEREYNRIKNGGERIIGEMEMGERKTHLYTLKPFLI